MVDIAALAEELTNAYATKTILPVPLSSREAGFDLATAYAIEAELGIPLLDTVSTTVWGALRAAGADPSAVGGWGDLFAWR